MAGVSGSVAFVAAGCGRALQDGRGIGASGGVHAGNVSAVRAVQAVRAARRGRGPLSMSSKDAPLPARAVVDGDTGSESARGEAALEPPPSTFFQAIKQAQSAVAAALADGYKLLEVEFPPLPADQLESASTSSYDVSDANVRLALDFAKRFVDDGFGTVVLAFPDAEEKDHVVELCGETDRPADGVRLGTIANSSSANFIERIWSKAEQIPATQAEDGMYIVLGASAQELPQVEMLVEAAGDRPVILFNLKLDVSRGDLGLPAFPRKDLHFRFLSTVLPVYYLRTRTYSRNVPRPPYLVNYSGALYKVYPGKWQVLLDTATLGGGDYKRIATLPERPPLGVVRDLLTSSVEVDGVDMKAVASNNPAPLMDFLRKGYKSTTWWEDDFTKQKSNNWRS